VKEIPRRRITVTSSSNEISPGQLENRVVERGEGVTPPAPTFSTAGFWKDKDDVNVFYSTSAICFQPCILVNHG
jgi:hypothetical protein